jgi:hypothetical protein
VFCPGECGEYGGGMWPENEVENEVENENENEVENEVENEAEKFY